MWIDKRVAFKIKQPEIEYDAKNSYQSKEICVTVFKATTVYIHVGIAHSRSMTYHSKYIQTIVDIYDKSPQISSVSVKFTTF